MYVLLNQIVKVSFSHNHFLQVLEVVVVVEEVGVVEEVVDMEGDEAEVDEEAVVEDEEVQSSNFYLIYVIKQYHTFHRLTSIHIPYFVWLNVAS